MYTALYRRYRPKTFNEIVGQDHIVKILKKQIQTGNTAHAYLFCGTRGTGKTSAARIFAKGVNCLSDSSRPCGKCENCESIQRGIFFDVIEIDAASNNKVDNIRELRESVKYPPAAGLCKVYIIDEVHMLSTGAFNALLKTLEEPPEHVIFVLATTEPHKLPATILSRCMRLDFRRVPEAKIKQKLSEICEEEGIRADENALALIAANGDGSVRDALSILEQCIPAGESSLTRNDVVDVMGTAGEEVFLEITDKVISGDTPGAFSVIERISGDGKDMRQFIIDWIFHFRNLMMSQYAGRLEDIMNMSCENAERVKAQGSNISMSFISMAITELSATANKARYSTQPRTLLELSVLKLANPVLSEEKEAILRRLDYLEKQIADMNSPAHYSDVQKAETTGKGKSFSEIRTKHESFSEAQNEIKEKVESKTTETENEYTKEEKNSIKTEKENTEVASIWKKAFNMALKERPSLKIIEEDMMPISYLSGELIVEAGSILKKSVLENSKEFLEKYLSGVINRPVKLTAVLKEEKKEKKAGSINETKAELEKLLGADKLTISE